MIESQKDNLNSLLKLVILVCIAGAAISSRLFSVIRHERCVGSRLLLEDAN